jgi:hypothetical protein
MLLDGEEPEALVLVSLAVCWLTCHRAPLSYTLHSHPMPLF